MILFTFLSFLKLLAKIAMPITVHFRIVAVHTKLLRDIRFIELIINADTHVYKNLGKNSKRQKYAEYFFQVAANLIT